MQFIGLWWRDFFSGQSENLISRCDLAGERACLFKIVGLGLGSMTMKYESKFGLMHHEDLVLSSLDCWQLPCDCVTLCVMAETGLQSNWLDASTHGSTGSRGCCRWPLVSCHVAPDAPPLIGCPVWPFRNTPTRALP